MTYGSWQSPYCPDPREFHGAALERLNEGSLFWVYIGHGHRTGLDRVRVPGARYPILSSADVPKIHAAQGSPIALMLACHTGAFDAAEDCLAEQMLARDGAPAAILCGSRVTMPYAMATMSQEMLAQCFERRRETVGELMLHAKREMMVEGRKNSQRQMLDVIAKLISPAKTTLADERREHLHLFNLIGDPTMRIAHPETVAVETSSRAVAGQLLEIAGTSPVDGRCTVELVVRRDRLTFDPPARSRYDGSDAALAAYQKTYRRANRAAYTSVAVDAVDGKFSTQLDVPTEANGPCHVRVFVAGKSKFAMGASNVYVQRSGAAAGN
jgi:hypothetical protein